MSFKYKVAVLGPIPRDHITTYRGETVEKYGGVNNPVIALATLLGEQSTVFPVVHLRERDLEPVTKTIGCITISLSRFFL